MRGAAAEEYINAKGYMEPGAIKDPAILAKYRSILQEQKDMPGLADKVLCVSDKLREYVATLNTGKNDADILTVPGAADQRIFFYDPCYVCQWT